MFPDTPNADPNEHDCTLIPLAAVSFLQILGWDGALPLITASAPVFIKLIWEEPPVAAGLLLVFSPPIAAFIRTQIGWQQITKRCAGRAPWLRQIAMAAAIVLLLLFEIAVSVLTFGKNIPAEIWWFPVGFYAGYLVMVSLALRSYGPRPADTVSDKSG
jgi:hypothetical protein